MKVVSRWFLAMLVVLQTQGLHAKDAFYDYSVDAALKNSHAAVVRDVPVFMVGQDHPAVENTLGEFTSNRRTNAFGKSDEDACTIAFLSAIISLQERAKTEGGDAVVDIKSITKHNDLVSASQYRCVSGALIANVALTGTIVRFAKP